MVKWTCLCSVLFLTTVFESCQSRGVLTVRLLNFKNPKGRTYDGSCCDHVPRADGICPDQCDYVMRLIVSGLGRANDHVFLFHRPLKYDSNDISFGEDQSSEMVLTVLFDHWPDTGHVKMNVFFYDYDDFDHTTLLVDWFETELRRKVEKGDYENAVVRGNRQRDKTMLQFEWSITCYTEDDCLHAPTDLKWPWGLSITMPNTTKKVNTEVNKIESDWAKQWKKDTEKLPPYQPLVKSTIHKENVIWGQAPTGSSEAIHENNQEPTFQNVNDNGGMSIKSKTTEMQSYPSKPTQPSYIGNKRKHSRGMMPEIKRPFNSRAGIKKLHTRNKNVNYKRNSSRNTSSIKENKNKNTNGKNYKSKSVVSRGKIKVLPPINKAIPKSERKPPFTKQIHHDVVNKRKTITEHEKSPYSKPILPQFNQEISRFGVGGKKTHNGTRHAKFPRHSTLDFDDTINAKTYTTPKITKSKTTSNKNKRKTINSNKTKVKTEDNGNSKSPYKQKTRKLPTVLPLRKTSRNGRFKTFTTQTLLETIPITSSSTVNTKVFKPTTSTPAIKTGKDWKQRATDAVILNAKHRKSSKVKRIKPSVTPFVSIPTDRTPLLQQTPAYKVQRTGYATLKYPFYNEHSNQLSTQKTPRNRFKSLPKITRPPSRSKKQRKYHTVRKTAKDNAIVRNQSIFEPKKAESYVPNDDTKPQHVWKEIKTDSTTKIPFHKHTHGGMLKTMSDLIREQEEEAEKWLKMQTTKGPQHIHKLKTSLTKMADNNHRSTFSKLNISTRYVLKSNHKKKKKKDIQWSTSTSSGTSNNFTLSKLNHSNSKKNKAHMSASPKSEISSRNVLSKPKLNHRNSKTNNTHRPLLKPETSTNYVLSKPNNINTEKNNIRMSTPKPKISTIVLSKPKHRSSNKNERIRDHKSYILKTKIFAKDGSKTHVTSTKIASVDTTTVRRLQTTVKTKGSTKSQRANTEYQEDVNHISLKTSKMVQPTLEMTTMPLSTRLRNSSLKHSDVLLIQTLRPVLHHNFTTHWSLPESTTERPLPWWRWTTAPHAFETSTKFGQWTQFTRWWQRHKTTLTNKIDTASTLPHIHIYTRRATKPFRRRTLAITVPTASTLPHTHIYTTRKTAINPFPHLIQTSTTSTASTLLHTHIYTKRIPVTNSFQRRTETITTPSRITLSPTSRRTTALNPFRRNTQTTTIPLPLITLHHNRLNTGIITKNTGQHTSNAEYVPTVSAVTSTNIKGYDSYRKIKMKTNSKLSTTKVPRYSFTTGKILKVTLIPKEITLQKQITKVTPIKITSQSVHNYNSKTITLPRGKQFGTKSRSKEVLGNNIKIRKEKTLKYSPKTSDRVTVAYAHTERLKPTAQLPDERESQSSKTLNNEQNDFSNKIKSTKLRKKSNTTSKNDSTKVKQMNKKVLKTSSRKETVTKSYVLSKKVKTVTTIHGTKNKSTVPTESKTVKQKIINVLRKTSSTKGPIFYLDSRIFHKLNKSIKKRPLISAVASGRPKSDNSRTYPPKIRPNIWKQIKKKKPRVLWNYVKDNERLSENNSSRWWLRTTFQQALTNTVSPKHGHVFDLKALVATFLKPNFTRSVSDKHSTVSPQPRLKDDIDKKVTNINSTAKKNSTKHLTNVNSTANKNSTKHLTNVNSTDKKNSTKHLTNVNSTDKKNSTKHLTNVNSTANKNSTKHLTNVNSTGKKSSTNYLTKSRVLNLIKTTEWNVDGGKTNRDGRRLPTTTRLTRDRTVLRTSKPGTRQYLSTKPHIPLQSVTAEYLNIQKVTPPVLQQTTNSKWPKGKGLWTTQRLTSYMYSQRPSSTRTTARTAKHEQSTRRWRNRLPNLKKNKSNKAKKKLLPWNRWLTTTNKMSVTNKFNLIKAITDIKKPNLNSMSSKQFISTTPKLVSSNSIGNFVTTNRPKSKIQNVLREQHGKADLKDSLNGIKLHSHKMGESSQNETTDQLKGYKKEVSKSLTSEKPVVRRVTSPGLHDGNFRRYSFRSPTVHTDKFATRKNKMNKRITNRTPNSRTATTFTTGRTTHLKSGRVIIKKIFKTKAITDMKVKNKNIKNVKSIALMTKNNTTKPTSILPSGLTIKQKIITTLSSIALSTRSKMTLKMLNKTSTLKPSTQKRSVFVQTSQATKDARVSNTSVAKGVLKTAGTTTTIPNTANDFPVIRNQTQRPNISTTKTKSNKNISKSIVNNLVTQTATTSTMTTTTRAKRSSPVSVLKQRKNVMKSKPNSPIRNFDLKHFLNFKLGNDHNNIKNIMTKEKPTTITVKMTTPTTIAVKKTTVPMKQKSRPMKKKVYKEQTRPPPSALSNPSIRGPGVVVPDEGLFVPKFVLPDIRHNINRNISEGSVAVLVHSGSEARHIGLQVKRLNIKTVFNRYWPAILGLTIGTVFLVAAILTSVACRAQRLYVQRTRYIDAPQHLTEPPDTSEYASSSSASLVSDRTRSSIRL